jgi:hypothetical protein
VDPTAALLHQEHFTSLSVEDKQEDFDLLLSQGLTLY